MQILSKKNLREVSGRGLVMDYTHHSSSYQYNLEPVYFTLQFDGSIPPEFQTMIDNGASFREMEPYLLIYQAVLHNTKILYPDLFTA